MGWDSSFGYKLVNNHNTFEIINNCEASFVGLGVCVDGGDSRHQF